MSNEKKKKQWGESHHNPNLWDAKQLRRQMWENIRGENRQAGTHGRKENLNRHQDKGRANIEQ